MVDAMIALYPPDALDGEQSTVEPLAAVEAEAREHPDGRPWILSNMIASADGATAIDGLSGDLGGPADFAVFMALRAISDAIVVGAATVVEEDYRPPGPGSEQAAAGRRARGQASAPLVVVVTASLRLDPTQRLFGDRENRPLIVTVTDAPADRRRALAEVADIVECGTGRVELPLVIDELRRRGLGTILVEGGPTLNAQFIADDLIDEWNLSVSPILAAGSSKRAAQGIEAPHPVAPMRLARVWQADDLLFCRWVRSDPTS